MRVTENGRNENRIEKKRKVAETIEKKNEIKKEEKEKKKENCESSNISRIKEFTYQSSKVQTIHHHDTNQSQYTPISYQKRHLVI